MLSAFAAVDPSTARQSKARDIEPEAALLV